MIHDLALRWIVTALLAFSAGVCVSGIARNRHSAANLVGHSLHAVMAIAMAVMAWPWGAELPPRAPMYFFVAAAVWFALVTVRTAGHHLANAYHTLMMLAMAWMYAAMGGLSLRPGGTVPTAMPDKPTAMPDMPAAMLDMPGMDGAAGHAGHAGHAAATHSGAESTTWVGTLNWLCAVGFAIATVFWLYRLVTARLQPEGDEGRSSVGILCQLAMAAGMAVMFGVML